MKRRVSPFVAVTLLALTFSSCTCSSSTPEAPPPVARSGPGFGMLKPTERSVPDVAQGVVTPKPVEARPAPTLPTAAMKAELPDDSRGTSRCSRGPR